MSNSAKYKIEPVIMVLIKEMMRRDGRDFGWCELGFHRIEGNFDIHHEKYEGATYYDLRISCRSCNCKNRGIQ